MKTQRDYLNEILRRIEMIETYSGSDFTAFQASVLHQETVMRSFEIIGEIVKRIPADVLNQRPEIPWRLLGDFRNLLIHEYDRVSLEVVWQIIHRDVPPLKQAVQALLDALPPETSGTDRR
ncbi:MAG: HepT-like ribonuclease domain-containing protein [Candidatus Flexifilum sp.]|jgi:uncharacterized protein with HEPN domain